MDVRVAAEYLASKGYPCGIGTVRALVKAGRLKCYRPGVTRRGKMSFTAEMLEAFLAAELAGQDAATVASPPPPAPPKTRRAREPRPAVAAGAPADWKARAAQAWGD